MQGGEMAVPDYELLELVLFRAIPLRDVKTTSARFMGVAVECLSSHSYP